MAVVAISDSLPTLEVPVVATDLLACGTGPFATVAERVSAPPPRPPRHRRLADRYELRRWLGGGGMAEVFHAWDSHLERDVAIKVMRREMLQDSRQVDRFRREAQLLAYVVSERVVQIYDSHFSETECYLVLRHLDGSSIEQLIESEGPMATATALQVVLDVLDGLRDLHALDLVHRDVKPANVVVDENGRAVLLDLGIAQDRRRTRITPVAHTIGTPGFMPPEQQRSSRVDMRSDLYQAGLLLLYVTTAINPSDVLPEEILGEMLARAPARITSLIARSMAPCEQRFQSVDEMAAAVRAVLFENGTIELALADLMEEPPDIDEEPILLHRRKSPAAASDCSSRARCEP